MSNYNVIVPHYSVMLADSLATIIQQQYSFKHDIRMELLSAAMNDIYRVYSGTYRYYLRIPRHERFWPYTLESYRFEMELLNYLRQADLKVTYPIPTRDKQFLGILNAPEGLRYYCLQTEATGLEPDSSDVKHMYKLGEYLAKFHQITERYQPRHQGLSWDLDLLLDYGLSKLKTHLPEDPNPDFKEILQRVRELTASFYELLPEKSSLIWGIIHGNYKTKHTRISDDGIVSFDFENCGYGYRIMDFAYIIHQTNITNLKNRPFQEFLKGYLSLRLLSDVEIKALQIMSKLILVSQATRSVGMRDLVGVLWFDQQIRNDLTIIKKIL